MKKIRVTVSDFMNEIITGDSEYFKLPVGRIGNIIFKYYMDKDLNKVELGNFSGEVIQFNLNKKNEEIFMDTLIRNKVEIEAEYWRNIFFTYINNLRYKREEILFENKFKDIREVCNLEVCKYQTTQDMWMEVMEKNPSYFEGGRRPVDTVSWWDTLEYCNRLSTRYGLQPVYDLSQQDKGILKINQPGGRTEYPNLADFSKTEGFRLPTEVEWEWFARGGEVAVQDGTFNMKYAGSNNIDEVAWYEGNSGEQTHDVGTKKPNQLRLYDCIGNVWEWCYDTGDFGYISEKAPYIYDESKKNRRLRGASWYDLVFDEVEKDTRGDRESNINVSNYHGFLLYSSFVINNLGFRIVRTI